MNEPNSFKDGSSIIRCIAASRKESERKFENRNITLSKETTAKRKKIERHKNLITTANEIETIYYPTITKTHDTMKLKMLEREHKN